MLSFSKGREFVNLYVQDMEFHTDPVLIFCVHLDAIDVAEIGQKSHQVRFGVNHMADSIFGTH